MKWPHSLRSLAHRDLRLYFAGQSLSLVGTWMQSVAQAWLVYRLTHSAQMLGVVQFLGQVPAFVFGLYAGSLADRLPRRRIMLFTQVNAMVQAALLAVVTLGGWVQPWHVIVLAAMLGMTWAFEMPARNALLAQIAGADVSNAVALNSTLVNSARLVGPAVAGLVVAAVGEGWCFALNAASFAGVLWALWLMRVPDRAAPPAEPAPGHVRDGLAYVARTPMVRGLLLLLATSSFFGLVYPTLLPVFAAEVLGGGPKMLGALQASAGAGALAGALVLLSRKSVDGLFRWVGSGATLLAGGLGALALSRHPLLSQAALVIVGFGFISQMVGTMTLLQHLAPEELRGRVLGMFSMLFIGVTPFGALCAGAIAQGVGAPVTLLCGAAVVLAGGLVFHLSLPRLRGYPAAPCPPPSWTSDTS